MLCGRIRFTTRGPAVFPHTCACEHCQKLGGAPVMWWVGFETVRGTWGGRRLVRALAGGWCVRRRAEGLRVMQVTRLARHKREVGSIPCVN